MIARATRPIHFPARSRPHAGARRGLTLLELSFSITLLVLGISAISRLTVGLTRAANVARETDFATQAAKALLERIQGEAFLQAFRRFNDLGTDDPSGANTAPGANFAVPGLRAAPGDADGLPGQVIFPTPAGGPGLLRENVNDARLGMPHDLNGDGVIDGLNHALDYKLLPVLVRVSWQSTDGTTATVELKTILANY
jgi:type II secretory pathway pseudopilin PulG